MFEILGIILFVLKKICLALNSRKILKYTLGKIFPYIPVFSFVANQSKGSLS